MLQGRTGKKYIILFNIILFIANLKKYCPFIYCKKVYNILTIQYYPTLVPKYFNILNNINIIYCKVKKILPIIHWKKINNILTIKHYPVLLQRGYHSYMTWIVVSTHIPNHIKYSDLIALNIRSSCASNNFSGWKAHS